MIARLLKELNGLEVEIFLGIELEFYSPLSLEIFLQTEKPENSFKNLIFKEEIGKNQIEVVFPFKKDVFAVLKNVISFRNKFKDKANFNAFVSKETPPSALQFNVSILQNGCDVLNEKILYFVLEETMQNPNYFVPSENCKKRLTEIEMIKEFRNSPFTFCIGGKNNRTSCIRFKEGFFEHRLPSPSCKVLKCFEVILRGILKGLLCKEEIYVEIVHSNAFEDDVISHFGLHKIYEFL
jgi:glutamine synthetase